MLKKKEWGKVKWNAVLLAFAFVLVWGFLHHGWFYEDCCGLAHEASFGYYLIATLVVFGGLKLVERAFESQ